MSVAKRGQSIVTKKGDKGYTYVYSGDKLCKDDLRLEVVGTMDELCSFLGMAKSLIKDKKGKNILKKIQSDLFIIASRISGLGSKKPKREGALKPVRYLEEEIEKLEKKYYFKNFVSPGKNLISSALHVARTVARRLERRVVTLRNRKKFKDMNTLVYLNRLSDLLFLLACRHSQES